MIDYGALKQEQARRSHLEFLRYTWSYTTIDFLTGFHIEYICEKIDEAMDKYERGESSFLCITLPFRHHKSQTVSRSFPPHFLGRFPGTEVIVASYNQSLSDSFSIDARNMMQSDLYKDVYPETKLASTNIKSWRTDTNGIVSKSHWIGMEAGATGKGANLLIVDDYLKGRADAESELKREKIWQCFSNDLLTRRPDPCIVIVTATQWHKDDLIGRIEERQENDSSFPRFEMIRFPAKASDYTGPGKYKGKYLFPEKFSDDWYEQQYATLGAYNASGLLDCNPSARSGAIIKTEEGVNWHWVAEKPEEFGAFVRGWDVASTEAQTQKDDPDYTVGVKVAVKIVNNDITDNYGRKIPLRQVHVYIDDIVRLREESTKRNLKMIETAVNDGPVCIQYVEAFAAYKDAYTTLDEILKGVSIVEPARLQGDKIAKVTTNLEVPFEAGNVYVSSKIPRDVVRDFMSEARDFPSGKHDDQLDALAVAVAMLTNGGGNVYEGVL